MPGYTKKWMIHFRSRYITYTPVYIQGIHAVYIFLCVLAWTYICMLVCTHVHACVCVSVHAARMCVSVCVCVCVSVSVHTARMCVSVHACVCVCFVHTHALMYATLMGRQPLQVFCAPNLWVQSVMPPDYKQAVIKI